MSNIHYSFYKENLMHPFPDLEDSLSHYPASILKDDKGEVYVVTFRDIPEALTQGYTHEEAVENALDALLTAFEFYAEYKRQIPLPSEALPGEELISVKSEILGL